MKLSIKAIVLAVVPLVLAFAVVSCDKTDSKTGQGQNGGQAKAKVSKYVAPPISGENIITGEDESLAKYKGKFVLINFWATWCPPCKHEIPDIIKLREKYKDNFEVLGVSLDRVGDEGVETFVKTSGITYPIIMGDRNVAAAYGGITAIPTSFIVNKEGELVEKIVGFRTYQQFEELLLKHLNK